MINLFEASNKGFEFLKGRFRQKTGIPRIQWLMRIQLECAMAGRLPRPWNAGSARRDGSRVLLRIDPDPLLRQKPIS
jgi:hypothetical protein